MENGHSLLVPGTADSITARAAAAAIRLWGNMWSQADRVVIFLENIRYQKNLISDINYQGYFYVNVIMSTYIISSFAKKLKLLSTRLRVIL